MPALLNKRYTEAAESMMRYIKNGVLTSTSEIRPMSDPATYINKVTVEGDFELFSLALMDTWGGHLRFVFTDTEAKDEDDIRARGEIAMLNPDMAALMTAKTSLTVYRQRMVRTRIIKYQDPQGLHDGKQISETREDVEEWADVTPEFHRVAMRELALGN